MAAPPAFPPVAQPAAAVIPSKLFPTNDPTAVPTATTPATLVPPTPSPSSTTPPATPTRAPSPTPAPPTPTPRPTSYDPARLKDLIGHAQRSYAGAGYALATNIEVAIQRIDGAVLAPGEVLSFLDRIGPQTAAAGFQMGYGIIVANGQAKTVPMMAGGICDVSTLLFQAAYSAGLPIVQRWSHSYWIESYGAPPDGGIGLEATVDVQPVDFKFRNATNDWLRIDAACQGGVMAISLKGVSPGWSVTIDSPIVANVVKTDRAVIRQPDPSLPPGAEVWIETAQDGFDVTRSRRVTLGKQVVDEYTFTSHYLTSHNVVNVGVTPSPTPQKTPSPTATGAASPTPTTAASRASVASAKPTSSTSTPSAASTDASPTATPSPAPVKDRVRVPSLVGLSAPRAQALVAASGLANTFVNYQGPGDVPTAALKSVPVGAVLSQSPPPGAEVSPGTLVYLAVRKS